jgi:hypothetical protein
MNARTKRPVAPFGREDTMTNSSSSAARCRARAERGVRYFMA